MKKAKKSLSQNFLIDKNIRKKIINRVKIFNKTILEIGPGYGFMTDEILENNPKKIILIEKDNSLAKYLINKYKNNDKIAVVCDDILNFDLQIFNNITVVSNLPYNLSTKIILYLFNFNQNIFEMIFMVQKEVAIKFDYSLAKMNKYKFLTFMVSKFTRCFDVSSKVFLPKPKVQSTVVKFEFNKKNIDLSKAKAFSNSIFKNVRKKIYKNIKCESKNELVNKRVNQITINDLLSIYNSF